MLREATFWYLWKFTVIWKIEIWDKMINYLKMRISFNLQFSLTEQFPHTLGKMRSGMVSFFFGGCFLLLFFIPHSSIKYLLNYYFHGIWFHKAVSPDILPCRWCLYIRVTPTSMVFRIVISLLSFLIHALSLAATRLYNIWSGYFYS